VYAAMSDATVPAPRFPLRARSKGFVSPSVVMARTEVRCDEDGQAAGGVALHCAPGTVQ
jgi:hypothetical protein